MAFNGFLFPILIHLSFCTVGAYSCVRPSANPKAYSMHARKRFVNAAALA